MLTDVEARLVELLDDASTISGILLHGSWSTGRANPESDFDLVCVLRSPWEHQRREFKLFLNSNADIYYAPAHVLRKKLQIFNSFNNNFILNVFVDGKVLVDRDGALASLAEIAKTIWAQGPPRPKQHEVEFSQAQFQAAFCAIERSARRCSESPELQGLLRLRCSELFSRMLYEYCRRRGVWTTSMAHLLHWAESNATELHSLARGYLESAQTAELVTALRDILQYLKKMCQS